MKVRQLVSRRELIAGLSAYGALAWQGRAIAGAARPLPLEELVRASQYVLVGTATDSSSNWEGGKSSRRIVTYHELVVQQPLDGRPPERSTLTVRTLGGSVGDVGQIVHGEAHLTHNQDSVLFLHRTLGDAFGVVGLAQGHFPIFRDKEDSPRLLTSPRLSDFTNEDPFSAVSRLRGKTVTRCEQMIKQELGSDK